MSTDDGIRASDGDRENAVAILRDAYVAGRLTLPEFDERTSAAFASRTWGELRNLTSDLPARPVLGAAAAVPARLRSGAEPAAGPATGSLDRQAYGRLVPALPIVLVWLAICLSARGAAAYVPLMVLLVVGLRVAGGLHYHSHYHDGHRHRRGHPGQPPQQGPGRPF